MRITRNQLRQLISEALEIHHAPEDLEAVNPEEAYGMGYLKGQDMQCDHPDWSPACVQHDSDMGSAYSLTGAELIDIIHRIIDEVSDTRLDMEALRDDVERLKIPYSDSIC